ncbi:hypothetical protein FACS189465_2080 [Clostridia bacterium]|nr:hypothetical protein FACS189465_2080 [Clostridia bacterium]
MPIISMFYGIIIRMQNREHLPPHIHVEYSGDEAAVTLEGEILKGYLPPKKLKMVQVWIEIHKEELETNWKIALSNEIPFRIDPLK